VAAEVRAFQHNADLVAVKERDRRRHRCRHQSGFCLAASSTSDQTKTNFPRMGL
jgi:hypothetical protein